MVKVVVEGDDPAVNPGLPEGGGVVSQAYQGHPLLDMFIGPHKHICEGVGVWGCEDVRMGVCDDADLSLN